MAEHFNESAYRQFSHAIQANMHAETAPTDVIELHAGNSYAAIRRRGAFITRLTLENGGRLLYEPAVTDTPKLAASHAMLPVGPYEGAGGQHGFLRWADYVAAGVNGPRRRARYAGLRAQTYDLPLSIYRGFALTTASVALLTTIKNDTARPAFTSFGEHLYFSLPDGATAAEVRLKQHSIDDVTYPGAIEQIKQGDAVFWQGYGGRPLQVDMPDKAFRIEATVHGSNVDSEDIGLLLWQRPGEPFICIEPTVGYASARQRPAYNNGAYIDAHGGALVMTTTIHGR
jgi:galactose mutarotase-like enzyme